MVAGLFYAKVVSAAGDYLGPAADRFMRRQISTHLGKEAEQLEPQDITALIDWITLTFALLTDDTALIDSFVDELTELARTSSKKTSHHGKR
jgi:ADP-ribosylglycohydrolase